MQFNLEQVQANINQIQSYDKGKIKLKETLYQTSLIITPDSIETWRPQSFADIGYADLDKLMETNPDVVILGTGELIHFLHGELLKPFIEKKIGVETMTTAAACRTYNVLSAEGRNVVAGLILGEHNNKTDDTQAKP